MAPLARRLRRQTVAYRWTPNAGFRKGPALRVVAAGVAAVGLLLAAAGPGSASYTLATAAAGPTLRVDAKGNAEVGWTVGGVHHSFVVPEKGPGYNGGLLAANVLKPVKIGLPMAVAVGQIPDGTYFALQQRTVQGRPTSLDLSRWRGAPTELTLVTDKQRLRGTATFQGKPLTGLSPTPGGSQIKAAVFIECFGCPGHKQTWMPMLSVSPKHDGSFAVYLRPTWVGTKYRATIAGQNVNGTLEPDAETFLTI
jgi:hypothetical protein